MFALHYGGSLPITYASLCRFFSSKELDKEFFRQSAFTPVQILTYSLTSLISYSPRHPLVPLRRLLIGVTHLKQQIFAQGIADQL